MKYILSVIIIIPQIIFSLLLFPAKAAEKWVQTNGPYGGAVTCLAPMGDTLFAGTSYVGIYRADSKQKFWTLAHEGNPFNYYSIDALLVTDTIVYAADFTEVWKSIDRGKSWKKTGTGADYVKCMIIHNGNIFAGTVFDGICFSSNKGGSWLKRNSGLITSGSSLPRIEALASNGNSIFAGTASGVFRSDDDGKNWILQKGEQTPGSVSCFATRNDTLFALTSKRLYACIPDSTWMDITPVFDAGDRYEFYSIAATDSAIYVGMNFNRVMIFTDTAAGYTISSLPFCFPYAVQHLLYSNGTLYAGTTNGVYFTIDDGLHWTIMDSGMLNTSVNSLIVRENRIFASMNAKVAITDDNGDNWVTATVGHPGNIMEHITECGENLLATTPDGFYLSDSTAKLWRKVNSGHSPSCALHFAMNNGDLFAQVGDSIFVSSDTGAQWSFHSYEFLGFEWIASSNGFLYTASFPDGLFMFDTLTSKWMNIFDCGGSSCKIYSHFFYENTIYIEPESSLYSSSDHGQTWKPIIQDIVGRTTAWARNSDYFLLGTNMSRHYCSVDNGETWLMSDHDEHLTTSSLAICNGYAICGTSGGGVWRWRLPDPTSAFTAENSLRKTAFSVLSQYHRNGTVSISISLPGPDQVTIRITDLKGKVIFSTVKKYASGGNFHLTLPAGNYAPGCYIISTTTNRFRETTRLTRIN